MRRAAVAGACAFLLAPASAHAHLVNTGLGPIFDGISHLLLSFDDLLPVVAMAMLAGLNGPAAGRRALFTLPATWLVGGAIGYAGGVALLPSGATSLSLLVLGILVAWDRKPSLRAITGLAAIVGLLHGWLNGVAIASAARQAIGLAGVIGAVFVLVALVAAPVAQLKAPGARIAVRVAGSWIAAVGLLYLGWTLSGRG